MRRMDLYATMLAVVALGAVGFGWSMTEYRDTFVLRSDCMEQIELPLDVSRPRFCDCYVSRLNSPANRIYRVASKIRHGDLDTHATTQECKAATFTPKPR